MAHRQTNDYTFSDGTLYFCNNFNKPLNAYHKIMSQATIIEFGKKFNQKIKLPPNVKKLTVGNCFNEQLELNTNLEILELGYGFNKPLDLSSTPKIKVLRFDNCFNQPLILQHSIENLYFGNNFNQFIFLTPKIDRLIFGSHFNKPLAIQYNLDYLSLGQNFNQMLSLGPSARVDEMHIKCFVLPDKIRACPGIKQIHINWQSVKPLDLNLIKNISVVACCIYPGCHIVMTKNILDLSVHGSPTQNLNLNKNIQCLFLNNCCGNSLFLTKKLCRINISGDSNLIWNLPKHLIFLKLSQTHTQWMILPKNLKYFLSTSSMMKIVILEHSIKELTIYFDNLQLMCIDNLIDGVQMLKIYNYHRDYMIPDPIFNLPQNWLRFNKNLQG